MPIRMDLRERALLDSDAGMKAADVAAKYRVSGSWVRLLKQRRRETGEVAPRVQRHGRRCMLEPHLHTMADLITAHPDRTLAELKDALATPASVPRPAPNPALAGGRCRWHGVTSWSLARCVSAGSRWASLPVVAAGDFNSRSCTMGFARSDARDGPPPESTKPARM